MIIIRTLTAALLVVTFSLFSSGAFAAKVDLVLEGNVVNAGFELKDSSTKLILSDGGFKVGDPFGWSYYEPGTGGATSPDYGTYRPDGSLYTQSTPEPNNVAYVDLSSGTGPPPTCKLPCDKHDGEYGDGTYPVGLEQVLTDTRTDPTDPTEIDYSVLRGNSKYELSVAVGNPKDFDGFGGYRLELLAGETVIGEDNNTEVIDEGKYGIASVFVLPEDIVDISLFGQALGIRLIHKSAQDNPGTSGWVSGIAFDNVQFSVSAVPVPAAVWLFGTALIGLIGLGKRRKAA